MAEDPSLTGVIGIIVLVSCYFMPTTVALVRGKHRAGLVALANFFLGWTVIGWLLALVWASLGKTKSEKREEQRHQKMMSMLVARR